MDNFLSGAEIFLRAEIVNAENKVNQAKLNAKRIENKNSQYDKQLKKVSQDFESIFLSYMLKQMRKTVPEDPLFGNSTAKRIFYEMYDEAVAKELARAGGIGLAIILYKQLSQIPGSPNINIKK